MKKRNNSKRTRNVKKRTKRIRKKQQHSTSWTKLLRIYTTARAAAAVKQNDTEEKTNGEEHE